MSEAIASRLNVAVPDDLTARLRAIVSAAAGRRIVFTTSLGIEDQAITHAIYTADLPIDVVTLDTGRLFPETYAVWADTELRYGKRIRAYYPDREQVENLVSDQGINGLYFGIDMRKACCNVRKIVPLARALDGAAFWITGLRAEQSDNRAGVAFAEHDAQRNLVKVNPLHDWPRTDLEAFIAAHNIPLNALHAQGFPSIGCAPCTRAVKPGEPERAGRWWWETDAARECGLHVHTETPLQDAVR